MEFSFSHSEINTLRDIFRPKILTYKKKEIIACQPRNMYILIKGLLYLCTEDEYYERSILRFMRNGELFTGDSVIDVYNGVSYITAKKDSEIAIITMNELRLFLSESIAWSRRFNEIFSHSRCLSINYMLHRKTIRNRLLTFLREEAHIQQSDSINVPIPFADLADYMGVDRTALMKEIGKMKKEGLIVGQNRRITLLV